MSMATSEKYKDKNGEMQDNTTWHNLVLWGVSADNAGKILGKGDEVLVHGKLQNRKWKDKDGNDRTSVEVVVDFWRVTKSKDPQQSRNNGGGNRNNGGGYAGGNSTGEDVPF